MSLRCFPNTNNNSRELIAEYNQYAYAIQEDLNHIDGLCQDQDSLTPKQLQTSINRLQENLDKIRQTYEKINAKVEEDNTQACGIPKKKFKAILITSIGTGGLFFGLVSLGISQFSESNSVSNDVKFTGFIFCIAGAVLKEAGDFLWNNWGNDESEKKMLVELKARATPIITNTETTIHILTNLAKTMEENITPSIEREQRPFLRSPSAHQRNPSSFESLMTNLKTVAETRQYRLSRIFRAPLPLNPSDPSRLNRERLTTTNAQLTITLTTQESTLTREKKEQPSLDLDHHLDQDKIDVVIPLSEK